MPEYFLKLAIITPYCNAPPVNFQVQAAKISFGGAADAFRLRPDALPPTASSVRLCGLPEAASDNR
jgi:hypothetical protein